MGGDDWDEAVQVLLYSKERRTLVITTRSAGIMTILGAGYIIQDVLKDEARRKRTKNRIILLMNICDLLCVFFTSVLGSVMIPKKLVLQEQREMSYLVKFKDLLEMHSVLHRHCITFPWQSVIC